jgi:integrase/recombinase XerD
MKSGKFSFQALLQKYFQQRMIAQMNVSHETIKSYRDTFRLYIKYLDNYHQITPTMISIEHLEAEYILGFLEFLEKTRGNQSKTINNRLSAIHSFIKYLSFEIPEYSGTLERGLMVPFRKEEKRQMDFLTKEEFNALLDVCDTDTDLGRRDKLMLVLLYNTGVRVSELTGLKGKDVRMDGNKSSAYIHIHGKGRKERNVPLWKNTAKYLLKYMGNHKILDADKLFMNYAGEELTRSGIRYRIDCLVKKASVNIPTLSMKTISPHTFRHSAALHLLQSGVDISTIAIWLGHESIETTHKYMEADMEMKRRILEKLEEPDFNSYHFRPNDSLITFLNSL